MGQAERGIRALVEYEGGVDEIPPVIDDDQRVRQREDEATGELDPRLDAEAERRGVGIDAGMGVDRVVEAEPQREDGRVQVPLELLELRVGEALDAELAAHHVD